MTFSVEASGPLFDGRTEKAVEKAGDEWERRMGILGASMFRSRLNVVLRKQTPVYRLRVEAKEDRPGWKIWDQRMVYGPWLEGTGSRNRTTRFKGYRTARITTAKLNKMSKDVAVPIVARYIGEVG